MTFDARIETCSPEKSLVSEKHIHVKAHWDSLNRYSFKTPR